MRERHLLMLHSPLPCVEPHLSHAACSNCHASVCHKFCSDVRSGDISRTARSAVRFFILLKHLSDQAIFLMPRGQQRVSSFCSSTCPIRRYFSYRAVSSAFLRAAQAPVRSGDTSRTARSAALLRSVLLFCTIPAVHFASDRGSVCRFL